MLAKVMVSLLAVAAISYGGAALYMGGCPFSACHSRCGGTQSTGSTSSCCQTPTATSCSTEQMPCCSEDAAVVGVCGSAIVSPQQ
jgi:hypothetical protein